MNRITMSFFTGLLWLSSLQLLAQNNPKGAWQVYAQAEEAGFSTEKLEAAKAQYDKMRSASLMVVHQGKVLAAWGDVSRRFMNHSMRKSLMSAMYGIYEAEGKIDLNKTLSQLGIDDLQSLSPEEKGARILDLITARSGIYHPAAYEPRSMKKNRPERGASRPGKKFNYNNWDFNTLLTILEQEAGIRFFEAFQKRIAKPLGMEDLRSSDMRYRFESELSKHAAYLFKMSTRDLARFGQLYLNEGAWNGKQLISKSWVAKSTAAYSTDLGRFSGRGAYGYLWWVDHQSFEQPAYYASGLGGHKLYVLPEADLVIVHRVNSYFNMGVREADLQQLVKLILAAKTGDVKANPKTRPLKANGPEIKKASVPRSTLKQYVGKYSHRFFRELEIYLDGKELRAKGEVLGNFRLFAQGNGRFVIEDLPELPMQFEKASEGKPKGQSVTLENERRIPIEFVLYY